MAGQLPKIFKTPPPNLVVRFVNNYVRPLESLIFIGYNPLTPITNFVNDRWTMLMEGVNPLVNWADRVAALRRLDKLSEALDLERTSTLEKLFHETGSLGFRAMRQPEYAPGISGARAPQRGLFGQAVNWLSQRSLLRVYEWTERQGRSNTFLTGYDRAIQNFVAGKWLTEIPAAQRAQLVLAGVDPAELEAKVSQMVRSTRRGERFGRASMTCSTARCPRAQRRWRASPISTTRPQRARASRRGLPRLLTAEDEARLAKVWTGITQRMSAGATYEQAVGEEITQLAREVSDGQARKVAQPLSPQPTSVAPTSAEVPPAAAPTSPGAAEEAITKATPEVRRRLGEIEMALHHPLTPDERMQVMRGEKLPEEFLPRSPLKGPAEPQSALERRIASAEAAKATRSSVGQTFTAAQGDVYESGMWAGRPLPPEEARPFFPPTPGDLVERAATDFGIGVRGANEATTTKPLLNVLNNWNFAHEPDFTWEGLVKDGNMRERAWRVLDGVRARGRSAPIPSRSRTISSRTNWNSSGGCRPRTPTQHWASWKRRPRHSPRSTATSIRTEASTSRDSIASTYAAVEPGSRARWR